MEEIKKNESPEKPSIVPISQIKKITPPTKPINDNLIDLLDQSPPESKNLERPTEELNKFAEKIEKADPPQQFPIKSSVLNNQIEDLLGFDDEAEEKNPEKEKKKENIIIDIKIEENKDVSDGKSNPFNFDFAKVSTVEQVKKDDIDSLFD